MSQNCEDCAWNKESEKHPHCAACIGGSDGWTARAAPMKQQGAPMSNIPTFVWCPQYCECVHEGGMVDLALCRDQTKALQILNRHRNKILRQRGKEARQPEWEIWRVVRRKIV